MPPVRGTLSCSMQKSHSTVAHITWFWIVQVYFNPYPRCCSDINLSSDISAISLLLWPVTITLWLKSNFQNNDSGCVIFRSLSELYLCGMCYQIKLSSNAVGLQNGDQLSAHLYVIQRLFEWLSQLIPIKDIMAYHLK